MFIDDYTITAIICAVIGCLIKYLNTYKATKKLKISYLICDVLTSAFLGYLTHWIITEDHLLLPSYASAVTCFIGYIGSQVFDIITWFLHTKYNLPNFKYEDKEQK